MRPYNCVLGGAIAMCGTKSLAIHQDKPGTWIFILQFISPDSSVTFNVAARWWEEISVLISAGLDQWIKWNGCTQPLNSMVAAARAVVGARRCKTLSQVEKDPVWVTRATIGRSTLTNLLPLVEDVRYRLYGHGPVSHASAAKIVTIYLWTGMVTAAVYRTITSLLQIEAFT